MRRISSTEPKILHSLKFIRHEAALKMVANRDSAHLPCGTIRPESGVRFARLSSHHLRVTSVVPVSKPFRSKIKAFCYQKRRCHLGKRSSSTDLNTLS